MKILKLICLSLLVILASCGDDDSLTNTDLMMEFKGNWQGLFDCNGPLAENEELLVISLKYIKDNEFIFCAEEDLSAVVYFVDDRIVFDNIIFNEGQGYDEIRIDGFINTRSNDRLGFNFDHDVDGEGLSQCDIILERKN